MANLKTPIPVPTTQITANYDYIDFQEGVGLIGYNCFATSTSSGTTYHMTTGTPGSSPQHTTVTSSNQDLTFDSLVFKAAHFITGTGVFHCSVNGQSNVQSTVKVSVHRVRGGDELEIVSQVTSATETGGSDPDSEDSISMILNFNDTAIRPGDKIRMKLNYAAGPGTGNIGHDPLNQSKKFGELDSVMKLLIPERLNT